MPSFSSTQNPSSGPIDSFRTVLMPPQLDFPSSPSDTPTGLNASGINFDTLATRNPGDTDPPASAPIRIEDIPTQIEQPPLPDTEDEEEKQRRMVFFSRIFPLANGVDAADIGDIADQATIFQGTPDPGSAPAFAGTPDPGSASAFAGAPPMGDPDLFAASPDPFGQYDAGNDPAQNAFFQQAPAQNYFSPPGDMYAPAFSPANAPYEPPYAGPISGPTPAASGMPFPQAPSKPSRLPKGCALWGAILIVPVLILVSIFGLGLTTFAPVLSMSGSTSVNLGGILHIHGRSFLANDTITLTVDNGLPIQLAASPSNSSLVAEQSPSSLADSQTLLLAMASALPAASTLKAGSDGTFNAAIMVNNNWAPGQHVIHAQESMSPRSATLAFSILSQVETLPSVTPTARPTDAPPTPTPHAKPTPTKVPPTPTPIIVSQLSSLAPNTLSLGTLSQGSTQTLTGQTTLKASGNAPVAWKASWNQQQNPWLMVSPTSGLISMPGSQQIAVMATAGSMQPGKYSATITFSSANNQQPLTLTVSFNVQSLCIQGAPATLSFTATAGGPDPAGQTVNLTNCGVSGPWTATVSNNSNWLTVNPAAGNLTGGASQAVTVNASVANSQLPAGNYTGTVTFASGSSQFQLTVNLVVQGATAGGTLQVTPASFTATQDCKLPRLFGGGTSYVCTVTLTSSAGAQTLNWTASPAITNPTSGNTVPAVVTIVVPFKNCQPGNTVTVTFTGPANAVPVTINC